MHLKGQDHRQLRCDKGALSDGLGDFFELLRRAERVPAGQDRTGANLGQSAASEETAVRVSRRRYCVTTHVAFPFQQSISQCRRPCLPGKDTHMRCLRQHRCIHP
eukprot:75480-Prymnesium_polylepis.2